MCKLFCFVFSFCTIVHYFFLFLTHIQLRFCFFFQISFFSNFNKIITDYKNFLIFSLNNLGRLLGMPEGHHVGHLGCLRILNKTILKLGNNLFVFCTLFKIHSFVSVIYFCLIEILTLICDCVYKRSYWGQLKHCRGRKQALHQYRAGQSVTETWSSQ